MPIFFKVSVMMKVIETIFMMMIITMTFMVILMMMMKLTKKIQRKTPCFVFLYNLLNWNS